MKFRFKTSSSGFTLIELLIAIAIFTVMSVMAYGGLSNVISNNESSKHALERLDEIQRFGTNIERDLSQIIARSIRDEYGNRQRFIQSDGINELIEFTRGGRRNPAGLSRSSLLRVAYRLDDSRLTRYYWHHLDRAQGAEPIESVTLSGVESSEIKFLDATDEWHNEWPPLSVDEKKADALGLKAIEFTITLKDWGKITRLIRVSTG